MLPDPSLCSSNSSTCSPKKSCSRTLKSSSSSTKDLDLSSCCYTSPKAKSSEASFCLVRTSEPIDDEMCSTFESCASVEEEQAKVGSDSDLNGATNEDKTVAVLSTDQLSPFEDPATEIPDALARVVMEDDWFAQYEGIVGIRRLIVHHSRLLDRSHAQVFIGPICTACDNLRSAMSKSAMLALAECFEFLDRALLESCLINGHVLDALLRRSACEKRFLRDAATFALEKMVRYLHSIPIIESAAAYADNKNAKICASAALVISGCLQELEGANTFCCSQVHDSAGLFKAFSIFLTAKESVARKEAKTSLVILARVADQEWFERGVQSGMDQRIGMRLLRELFPTKHSKSTDLSLVKKKRGTSLRERIQQQMDQPLSDHQS